MKRIVATLALITIAVGPALAQQDHAAHHPPEATKTSDYADGDIRRIDKAAAKITLRHGEIKNLDMPPMTMVFQVKNASLLDSLTVGAKVRFRA